MTQVRRNQKKAVIFDEEACTLKSQVNVFRSLDVSVEEDALDLEAEAPHVKDFSSLGSP